MLLNRIMMSWLGTATALAALAAASVALPPAAPVALGLGGALVWRRRRWLATYPLKAPRQSRLPDPNQPHPASGKPTPAQGIFYLGNEMDTGKEVWLTGSDARQHFLGLGSTGAGKTESFIGLAANALSWGSGFLIMDGKGDVGLYAKVHALCTRFGRQDSLLVLNFMTGRDDVPFGRRFSHRMNPFRSGSSDSLTQLIVSLMDDVGSDGSLWKGRSIAMLTGVMRAACWLRDNDGLVLTPGVLRDMLSLKAIIDLSEDERLPSNIAKSVEAYLKSLPGFQMERGVKQAQTTLDQHGYLEMNFTRILGALSDVYGHIFSDDGVDVDLAEVIRNRRILVVLLPALEKSSSDVANLGKVITASLKGACAATLGSSIEGVWADVVDSRPTNADAPFVVIADEAGYYLVDGLALLCAQARSLGISMIVGSQDLAALKRLNQREAASIIANTNTKIFMRLETNEDIDLCSASVDQERFDFLDLKAQSEGQAHLLFQDRLVRTRLFYANPWGAVKRKDYNLGMPQLVSLDWATAQDAALNAPGPTDAREGDAQ